MCRHTQVHPPVWGGWGQAPGGCQPLLALPGEEAPTIPEIQIPEIQPPLAASAGAKRCPGCPTHRVCPAATAGAARRLSCP